MNSNQVKKDIPLILQFTIYGENNVKINNYFDSFKNHEFLQRESLNVADQSEFLKP